MGERVRPQTSRWQLKMSRVVPATLESRLSILFMQTDPPSLVSPGMTASSLRQPRSLKVRVSSLNRPVNGRLARMPDRPTVSPNLALASQEKLPVNLRPPKCCARLLGILSSLPPFETLPRIGKVLATLLREIRHSGEVYILSLYSTACTADVVGGLPKRLPPHAIAKAPFGNVISGGEIVGLPSKL